MSTQAKTTANKGKTKDVITQIKKDTEGVKDTKGHHNEDIDWNHQESEEEEEVTQKKQGVVVEQGKVGTDKPKKLKDLFNEEPAKKTKIIGAGKPEGAKRPQTGTTKDYKGDVRKPQFTNTRGVQNKDVPLTGPVSSKPVEKLDQPKKFVNTGLLNKAAQENTKVKAPTKDYLEADSGAKYKEQTPEVEIEKPRFVNKNVGDSSEPHFKEINKNEDLFLKKMAEKPTEENIYSEPKTEKTERPPKKEFKERGPREHREPREYREPREPREYREKKEKKDEKEVDSDGFEIVSTVKTKPEDFKPKKKFYNNDKRDKRDFKKGDRGGHFKKPFDRKQGEENQEEKVQSGDEQQPIQKEDPKEKIADKKTIKIDSGVKKLKDLFA